MPTLQASSSLLIRSVRLVPVGELEATPGVLDLRVTDGVITAVGRRLRRSPGEELLDAGGRFAIPGLWDHHVHLLQWSQTRSRIDLSGTTSVADATDLVSRHLAQLPADSTGSVVLGFGHRSGRWPTQPTVADLDAVSGDHPVILISGDAHHGWLNSAALALLDVPPRNTVVTEDDWFPLYARLQDLPDARAAEVAAYQQAVRAANAVGVVGVTDMEFDSGYHRWPARVAAGIDTLRVRVAAYPDVLDDVVADGLGTGDPLPGSGGMAVMGPLKVISDGSLNTRTAHCLSPYLDSIGLPFPAGRQNVELDELVELFTTAVSNRLEVACHAIGDAAVETALAAFEATGARGSIEHDQLTSVEQILRMARLGLRASVQPAHLVDDRDLADQCWWDRADRVYMFRSMLDAGVDVVFGSDAPVSPLDPWLAMATAVHRSDGEREPWHPEQSVTVAEALAASTNGQSTIGLGSLGDIAILDSDPLAVTEPSQAAAEHLRSVRVAATVVGGRVVHSTL